MIEQPNEVEDVPPWPAAADPIREAIVQLIYTTMQTLPEGRMRAHNVGEILQLSANMSRMLHARSLN
jgi:hypothetical protein